ncbi:MAG: ABC transporter permease [Gammaproteobacteria bacterium]|nr:ABC transporter permease [Gammaproteobacteria bacterium]
MHAILTVFGKEVVDNFRDRRTMISALLLGPLLGPLIFVGIMSFTLSQQLADVDETLELPVLGGELAPNLMRFLQANNVEIETLDPGSDARALVAAGAHTVILIVSDKYPDYFRQGLPAGVMIVADQSDQKTQKSYRQLRGLLAGYSKKIGALRLQARGVSSMITEPVLVDSIDVSTPAARAIMILGMLTYFLIFAVLMGGMYLAIDTTAGERERGSLESLLTVPASRTNIIIGKMAATCAFMAASALITITAFYFSIQLIPLEKLDMVANFPVSVAARSFLVMLPFVLFAAAFMTIISTFTKTYKEAQSYLSMSMMLPVLPIMFAVFAAVKPAAQWLTIPSLSQHLLITEMIKGNELEAQAVLISAVSTTAFGVFLAWLAIRRYHSEGLLL